MAIDLEAIRADNLECDAPNPNIDILIAEVERLRAEVIFLQQECPACHFRFLYKSNLDRHPCPPPFDYDFGVP